ncbi:MAG: helix-turn-helix transcriptional regulator [Actinomycetota bacterium]
MATTRNRLAELRRQRGFSQESLGQAIDVGTATVQRWELGKSAPRPRVRPLLADALQITLPELERLLSPQEKRAGVDGDYFVPSYLGHYATVERSAARIQMYEPTTITGLLQTPAYMTAIMRDGSVSLSDDEVAERVAARIDRQKVLDRQQAMELVAIIDESALYRPTGGSAVMAEQLAHVIDASTRPTVQVRLLPLDHPGAHSPECGTFSLFSDGADSEPYLAATYTLVGFNYIDYYDGVAAYQELFDFLLSISMDPDRTREAIKAVQEGYECNTPPHPHFR